MDVFCLLATLLIFWWFLAAQMIILSRHLNKRLSEMSSVACIDPLYSCLLYFCFHFTRLSSCWKSAESTLSDWVWNKHEKNCQNLPWKNRNESARWVLDFQPFVVLFVRTYKEHIRFPLVCWKTNLEATNVFFFSESTATVVYYQFSVLVFNCDNFVDSW